MLSLTDTIYGLYPPPWLLLLSRVIIGLGAGMILSFSLDFLFLIPSLRIGTLGQSRGYVSEVTTKEQRTRYVAYLTVSQFAGFAVTPGLSLLNIRRLVLNVYFLLQELV